MLRGRTKPSAEYEHFAAHNWCVLDNVLSQSDVDLIEEYVDHKKETGSFPQEKLFKHFSDEKIEHDEKRRMFDCASDWVLYNLIRIPVTLALARHGLLLVVGSILCRAAHIVTHIESLAGGVNQSWHSDFDELLAGYFWDHFGISVLVATSDDCEVDFISDTWGGESDDDIKHLAALGKVKKVKLKKGQCLCMGSGLLHRGVAYKSTNVRLFLAFLVGKSCEADFSHTYGLDDIKDEQKKEEFFMKFLDTVQA